MHIEKGCVQVCCFCFSSIQKKIVRVEAGQNMAGLGGTRRFLEAGREGMEREVRYASCIVVVPHQHDGRRKRCAGVD